MRIAALVLGGAIALVIAAIVHFTTVLAVPRTGPNDAWARVGSLLSDEDVAVLPAARPGEEILPLLDPNLVYGICRFDVADGPFGISATMPPTYWSLSLQTPNGVVFYAVDDAAATDGTVDVELRDPDAMRRYLLARGEGEAEGPELAVETPTTTGYALMRALVGRGAKRSEVEAMMRETFCGAIEEVVVPQEAPAPERPAFPFPPERPEDLGD